MKKYRGSLLTTLVLALIMGNIAQARQVVNEVRNLTEESVLIACGSEANRFQRGISIDKQSSKDLLRNVILVEEKLKRQGRVLN